MSPRNVVNERYDRFHGARHVAARERERLVLVVAHAALGHEVGLRLGEELLLVDLGLGRGRVREARERDDVARLGGFWRVDAGQRAVRRRRAEHHAVRREAGELLGLEVRRDQDHAVFQIVHLVVLLQARRDFPHAPKPVWKSIKRRRADGVEVRTQVTNASPQSIFSQNNLSLSG